MHMETVWAIEDTQQMLVSLSLLHLPQIHLAS